MSNLRLRSAGWAVPPGRAIGILTAAILAAGCAHTSREPAQPAVRKLKIEGAKQVSQGTLKEGIATASTGWWPFAKKQPYDPFTWQTDLRRIERIYQSRGFFQAKVARSTVEPVDESVEIVAVIEEGEPTKVASFEVRGLEVLTENQRREVLHGVVWRGTFSEARWESAKATVAGRVRDLGYQKATVEGRALVDIGDPKAHLLLDVRPGRRYRFGEIQVHQETSHRLLSLWVWEQVRLAIPEDRYYAGALLDEAQHRLVAMGVFSVTKVTVGEPDEDSDRVPIVVDVREAPLHMLRAGVGIEFDQVREEGRVSMEWSHLDFLGGMRRLTLHGEAGWAFIPNLYAVARNDVTTGPRSGPVAVLRSDLEQPRFLRRPSLRGKLSLSTERTLEQAYDALGAKLATGVSWQPWSSLSVYATYNLQGYYLNGPAISSAVAAPLTLGCASQSANCFILLSYLEQIVSFDRRDSALEPHSGYFTSVSFQEGGGPLGGDFTYLRILPEVRGYLSFGSNDVVTLSARLRIGELLHTGSDSAVVTRFFAGGGVSMRGFSDRRLSPLLEAPAPSTQFAPSVSLTLPVGGNGLIEGSFETRFQLTRSLVAAVFLDFGQVTKGVIGPNDVTSLLWAAGFGLRYRTSIGPIRLDIARRLPWGRPPPLFVIDPNTGTVSQIPYLVNDDCFGFGGSGRATPVTDSSCVFHVAIGEAF